MYMLNHFHLICNNRMYNNHIHLFSAPISLRKLSMTPFAWIIADYMHWFNFLYSLATLALIFYGFLLLYFNLY